MQIIQHAANPMPGVLEKHDDSGNAARASVTLLNAQALETVCTREHLAVETPELRPYVARGWMLRWDCPEPFLQRVVPDPCVHIIAGPEPHTVDALGLVKNAFTATFQGTGFTFGLKFRPGGWPPFSRMSAASLTGRRLPLQTFFSDAPHASYELKGRAIMNAFERLLVRRGVDTQIAARVAEVGASSTQSQVTQALPQPNNWRAAPE